ncbi:L,D-transpeptidase family protein, partial [Enterococcus faecium]|uniref:L,D-transpeptidase family protein n=1 Tax=Enterococcus faecium TaxID=1352 RepID=UPI0034E96AB5
TLRELNIPAKKRYAQLLLNFQRITQFTGLTNEEYVLVNIPEFKLRYVNKGNVILKNRVVVGKPSWKTPAFSDQIEKFVVNPTWRIPLSITTREIA